MKATLMRRGYRNQWSSPRNTRPRPPTEMSATASYELHHCYGHRGDNGSLEGMECPERSRNKGKITRKPSGSRRRRRAGADDGAPLLKLPKHWIAGAHHTAYGKSPSTASEETTAGNVAAAAKNLCIILLLNCIQIHRIPGSGRGAGKVARRSVKPQGTPPPEGICADNRRTNSTSASEAPLGRTPAKPYHKNTP